MTSWRSMTLSFFTLYTVIIGLSMKNMFSFWMMLELNMMIFLMFLMLEENMKTMMKYFLIQAMGSAIFIWTFLMSINSHSFFTSALIISSLVLKAGGAPFHNWMINMFKNMKWSSIFIMSSIQKFMPLTGMFFLSQQSFKIFFVVTSMLIATYGSLLSTLMKQMMAFSSIFALAWMMSSDNLMTIFLYLIFYTMNMLLITSFLETSVTKLTQELPGNTSKNKKIILIVTLLSMAGMPPLTGFLAKLFILWEFLNNTSYLLMFLMIFSSVLILLLYIRMCSFYLTTSKSMFTLSLDNFSKLEMILFSSLFIPLCMLLLSVLHSKIWFF